MLRMAGQALKFLKGGATTQDLALRLGMDALGGTMSGVMAPGDLGDKLIVGATDALGGSVGGLLAGRIAGKNQALGTMLDMAGSYGGAMASMPISEKLLQGKDLVTGGRGESPWQKMGRQEQEKYAQQLEQQILAQYGLMHPGAGFQLGQANVAGVMGNGLA